MLAGDCGSSLATMVVPPSLGGGISLMAPQMRLNGAAKQPPSTSATSRMGANIAPIAPSLQTNGNIVVPLSARKAQPLDLSSVERRGQPNAPREIGPKLARPHGLQEAPTFRPTEDEFKNPMEYIKKIAPEGRKYGIVKVIPPDGWNPDFAIDTERFHFKTRKQELNMAEGGTRANLTYLDALAKFHKQINGTNLNRFPSVDKRPLDLFKLKKLVEDKGGFDNVCKHKRWAEIGRELGYSGKIMSSLSTSLKNSYQKWLQPYEDWLRFNKPTVLQQQEIDNGGPYTPSPAPTPVKSHQGTPTAMGTASPAIRASAALNASLQESLGPVPTPVPSIEAPPRPLHSGFTPVNAGGFTAVNVPPPTSGFSAINAPAPNGMHREPDTGQSTPHRSIDTPLSSAKNTPDLRPTGLGLSAPPALNGQGFSQLKRQLSNDVEADSGASGDAGDAGRRSKRLKKGELSTSEPVIRGKDGASLALDAPASEPGTPAELCRSSPDLVLCADAPPTVTGSHMIQPRLPPQQPNSKLQAPRDRSNEIPGTVRYYLENDGAELTFSQNCEMCGKGLDLIICEECKSGYHPWCLDPPLKGAPEDWHCPRCLVCNGDYGFQEGNIYSLKEFQDMARERKEKHFKDRMPFDPILNLRRLPTEEDVEREFWRLTESLEGQDPVEYGADIHSTTHGSGFPTMEKQPYNRYSTDPWNLNILPLDKDSLFRHIKTDICGMTVPWLYVGMCFSTFCWHSEDHYTYSANYQHFGATKTWYGIPSEDSERFEQAMREAVPELFEQQPDLLFQLVTLMQPEKLKNAGVRVYALDQRAGQFVITFPQAYHAGFNHGFNFNEAVNFAPSDWEPFGASAIQRLQNFRRQPVFCHEELLFSAASRDHTIKTARWLGPALKHTMERELALREEFTSEYRKAKEQMREINGESGDFSQLQFPFVNDPQELSDDDIVCAYCKAYGYLSRFICNRSGKTVCLLHAGKFECCDASPEETISMSRGEHAVHIRLTNAELTSTVQKAMDLCKTPEVWSEKLDKALDDPKPSLKTLRSLVTEGEKINTSWELPELSDLKRFVEKCNKWVEEATEYITRKQQNRRKNERAWRKNSSRKDIEQEEKDHRSIDNIKRLLATADELSFDCPELDTLRERAEKIMDFRKRARLALGRASARTEELDELIEEGKNFYVDMPEVEQLEKKVRTVKWYEDAESHVSKFSDPTYVSPLSLSEVSEFIQRGKDLLIADNDRLMEYFVGQREQGEFWEGKAKELMAVEEVNFQQLDALSKQAMKLPVSKETLAQIDAMLQKQRDAQEKILSLYERSKDPDFRKRPHYKEVVTAMEALEELNSKPPGTIDLEKEQKRHEDWMRRGKKLFGKTNAPLHILHQHMKYVEERNESCLDIRDQPRMPVEPASRANSPAEDEENLNGSQSNRDVFCICRRPESGMMIECELCHEWYHGKCLKIARGKVKEDDKYTCPICDYRLRIPRDATRPKLEDLEVWQGEISELPFQPEEEETLKNIIDHATTFREHVRPFINPMLSNPDELSIQRFYLRKIEGAEILLTEETNFFRQELHRWAPVAPLPPPKLEVSLSTRKPRPTKQQKLMAQMGITDPMDLPEHLRPKQPGWRKKGVLKKTDLEAIRLREQQQTTESHTPPGHPPMEMQFGGSSGVPTTLPTREDRASTFSYDAMAGNEGPANTSTFNQHSPMFASAGPHDFGRPAGHSLSPLQVPSAGIDPQLENMFGHPGGSTSVDKDHVPTTAHEAGEPLRDTAGEDLDMFMQHDADESNMFTSEFDFFALLPTPAPQSSFFDDQFDLSSPAAASCLQSNIGKESDPYSLDEPDWNNLLTYGIDMDEDTQKFEPSFE